MLVDIFDFELPGELIAQTPAVPRESARLLDLSAAGMTDRTVADLPALLQPGDVLVSNDTRVIPARLFGQRGEVKVEVTLHKRVGPAAWHAFARPGKRLKTGQEIRFADDFTATIAEKFESGEIHLDFSLGEGALFAALERYGAPPLPPYIRRERGGDPTDRENYQTIFARHDGAVAAPTAGLHFTDRLLAEVDARGIARETITLHVGAGTFMPVKVADTADHHMHSEWGEISPETAERLNRARAAGGRLVAIGTTSLRLLESAADAKGVIRPFSGETDIFITPGYKFRAVDLLLTNFHLPKSTLFMLISAFSGLDRMKRAYAHAIAGRYRFYSYGDCCLLARDDA
ncbi:MAG: tRNA preQ1(34) S-adenosylmethionine ribosyltransferase-isomerase QueA [Rhodospirillales bacterium]